MKIKDLRLAVALNDQKETQNEVKAFVSQREKSYKHFSLVLHHQ
jgi:hypothetical protein